MPRFIRLLCAAVLFAATALSGNGYAAQTDDALMRELCKEFVSRYTDIELAGQGSWMFGKVGDRRYVPGKSDHDMRLIIKNGEGLSDDAVGNLWAERKMNFYELAKERLGDKADDLLSRTNMYAPEQIMGKVEDAAGTKGVFKQYGTPDVTQHGPATDAQATAASKDGIFGNDTKAWKQNYENKVGAVFYGDKGKGYMGRPDLLQMTEGYGKFSIGGCGKTAAKWADDAAKALDNMNLDSLIKNLERAEVDLMKARSLARLGSDTGMRREVADLVSELKKTNIDMTKLRGRFKDVIGKCKVQAGMFRNLDAGNPKHFAMMQRYMERVRWDSSFLGKIGKYVDDLPIDKLVTGMSWAMRAYSVYSTVDDIYSNDKTVLEGILRVVPEIASLPAALMLGITQSILDEAKTSAATMVANKQDALDLIAGMFTVGGREANVVDEKMPSYTIQDLVRLYTSEKRLEAFIWGLADRASRRSNASGGLQQGDDLTTQAVFDKCYPVILGLWRQEREMLRYEFLLHSNSIMTLRSVLVYAPNPLRLEKTEKGYKPASVKVEMRILGAEGPTSLNSLNRTLARMKAISETLTGDKSLVNAVNVYFRTKGGRSGDGEHEQYYTFDKPGTYEVEAYLAFLVDGEMLIGNDEYQPLRFDESFAMSVMIEVLGEEEKEEEEEKEPLSDDWQPEKPEEKKDAAKAKQEPAKKEYAWVYVDSLSEHVDNEYIKDGRSVTHTAAPGHYTTTNIFLGPTRKDGDRTVWEHGQKWASSVDWTKPPSTIPGGGEVSLSFNMHFTVADPLSGAREWTNADFTRWDEKNNRPTVALNTFPSEDGKTSGFHIGIKHPINPESRSGTVTAKAPVGKKEGEYMAVRTMTQNCRTNYIYVWKEVGEKKEEKKEDEFVWVLTDVIRWTKPNTTKKEDFYHNKYLNNGTSFMKRETASQRSNHSMHDGHDSLGEYFEAAAQYSKPPSIIKGGETVSVRIRIAPTGRYQKCYYWGESAGVNIDQSDIGPGVITRGAVRFYAMNEKTGKRDKGHVHCGNGRGGLYQADSGEFTATMPKGGKKAGETRSLYYVALDQQTEYVYTWTLRSEARAGKIEPKEKKQ